MNITDAWVDFVYNAIRLEGYEYPERHTREVLEAGTVHGYTGPLRALWLLYAAREAILHIMLNPYDELALIEKLAFTRTPTSPAWVEHWVSNYRRHRDGKEPEVFK